MHITVFFFDRPWRFFNRRNDILIAMNTDVISEPRCVSPSPTDLPTGLTTIIQTVTTGVDATTSHTDQPTTKPLTTELPPIEATLPGVLPDIPLEVR